MEKIKEKTPSERVLKMQEDLEKFLAKLDQNSTWFKDLVNKWSLSHKIFAEKAGLTKQTFTNAFNNNETNPGKPAKFKAKHLDTFFAVLKEIRDDIDKCLENYQNSADPEIKEE